MHIKKGKVNGTLGFKTQRVLCSNTCISFISSGPLTSFSLADRKRQALAISFLFGLFSIPCNNPKTNRVSSHHITERTLPLPYSLNWAIYNSMYIIHNHHSPLLRENFQFKFITYQYYHIFIKAQIQAETLVLKTLGPLCNTTLLGAISSTRLHS